MASIFRAGSARRLARGLRARTRIAGPIALSLLAGAPTSARAADDAAIMAPARALEQAWNAGDGQAWGRAFWPDADSVNIYGGTLHGGEAMGARHAVVFAGRLKGTRMHSELVDIRPLGRDAAVVQTIQTVDAPPGADSKLSTLKVFVTMVTERRHGVWKVAHVQNTTITRPGAE